MEPLGQQDKKKKKVNLKMKEQRVGVGTVKKAREVKSSCQKDLQGYDPSRNTLSVLTKKWKTLPQARITQPHKVPKETFCDSRMHYGRPGSHFSLYQNPHLRQETGVLAWCHRGATLSPILELVLEEQAEFSFTGSAPTPFASFILRGFTFKKFFWSC